MSHKIRNEIVQFFDELKNTNQIKSYHHSCEEVDDAEIFEITFNSGKTIKIKNWGVDDNNFLDFEAK